MELIQYCLDSRQLLLLLSESGCSVARSDHDSLDPHEDFDSLHWRGHPPVCEWNAVCTYNLTEPGCYIWNWGSVGRTLLQILPCIKWQNGLSALAPALQGNIWIRTSTDTRPVQFWQARSGTKIWVWLVIATLSFESEMRRRWAAKRCGDPVVGRLGEWAWNQLDGEGIDAGWQLCLSSLCWSLVSPRPKLKFLVTMIKVGHYIQSIRQICWHT